MSSQYVDSIYGAEGRSAIAARTRLLAPPVTPDDLRDMGSSLAEVEVIFSGWNAPVFDAALLALAPQLRAIFYAGGSVRYFVTDEVWRRRITVSSAYAMNGEAVADYTVGATLFALKGGFAHAAMAKRGAFADGFTTPGVHGGTVGLVSLGATGRAVARKLAPFGVNLIGYDPFISALEASAFGVALCGSLSELFAHADVISLHTPLLPTTIGLISEEHFRIMRAGATFINTARGAIVREGEMITVLNERPDLTAILDVTYPEPPAQGSPLYTLSNVVLTPHIAGAMGRECRRMGETMIAEFDRWAQGAPLCHEIKSDQLARMA
jgi:phosphoglycerate dehydrogenase-like enzyme